jgi:hypothetical protein
MGKRGAARSHSAMVRIATRGWAKPRSCAACPRTLSPRRLHQTVGRVVATRGLAGVALALGFRRDHSAASGSARVSVEGRPQSCRRTEHPRLTDDGRGFAFAEGGPASLCRAHRGAAENGRICPAAVVSNKLVISVCCGGRTRTRTWDPLIAPGGKRSDTGATDVTNRRANSDV